MVYMPRVQVSVGVKSTTIHSSADFVIITSFDSFDSFDKNHSSHGNLLRYTGNSGLPFSVHGYCTLFLIATVFTTVFGLYHDAHGLYHGAQLWIMI